MLLTTTAWKPDDDRMTTRGWVLWHLMEHEAHHGGAISIALGANGLPSLDL